ncbi:MAG: hypothetical protein GC153_05425 [Alphaproteobacteria bacterium]|nr:hypothetical protein [Alphaproteobacteria bacterium]
MSERIDAFNREVLGILETEGHDNDIRDHTPDFEQVYHRWFPEKALSGLIADADKIRLHDLFVTMLDYLYWDNTDNRRDVRDAETVFAVLEKKGWADDKTVTDMHEFYVSERMFDAAAALRRKFPDVPLKAPPPIVDAHDVSEGRAVLAFADGGAKLVRERIDLSKGSHVVVIGHPKCHFTQNAVAAISADPELSKAMAAHAIWLTGIDGSLTDEAFPEWNRAHPQYAYRIVEWRSDWPEINYWGTPTFYFFKGGHLVRKIVGWPPHPDADEDPKAPLWAGFKAIGVDETATAQAK